MYEKLTLESIEQRNIWHLLSETPYITTFHIRNFSRDSLIHQSFGLSSWNNRNQGNWGKRFSSHELNSKNDHTYRHPIAWSLHTCPFHHEAFPDKVLSLLHILVVLFLYLMVVTITYMCLCIYDCVLLSLLKRIPVWGLYTERVPAEADLSATLTKHLCMTQLRRAALLPRAAAWLEGAEAVGELLCCALKGLHLWCGCMFLWMSVGSQNVTLKWFWGTWADGISWEDSPWIPQVTAIRNPI